MVDDVERLGIDRHFLGMKLKKILTMFTDIGMIPMALDVVERVLAWISTPQPWVFEFFACTDMASLQVISAII
ncbi:hypothetical protein SUGI_0133260 [Cryptomeria japonica]|nr:hypothetical protein SUGI_0133260 [Cryptomeria japonica]